MVLHDVRLGILAVVLVLLAIPTAALRAANASDLNAKINDHNQQIQALDAEIAQYEKQLNTVSSEKKTLQSAVQEIDLSRKKVQATISKEEQKIKATELEIEKLGGQITFAESRIAQGKDAVGEALRRIDALERDTYLEILLRGNSISDIWDEADADQQFQQAVRTRISELAAAKVDLESSKSEAADKHAELKDHERLLVSQKQALDVTKREKDSLLKQTADKESSYQDLLAEKKAQREAFEDALAALQSELAFTLDPSKVPPAGKGVLRWPLDAVTVTQKFGNTAFAKSGAYNGSGHNGIDFRASIGTPVRAALSGTVIGTGNTDAYKGCYSYGKWVLVRHPNGLSTLYAHLSQVSVGNGDSVNTGSIIGLSGNTGYSTGPHLHFTVFLSDAVQLRKLGEVKAKTNCAQATIPVSAYEGYLDPLEYL